MPVSPTYPGVYIEEIPSGVRTITGVPTSVTAFVGLAARGPVDDPQFITSFADYERQFGRLAADNPMAYSVLQYYQNGGSLAVVVRVAGASPAAALVDLGDVELRAASPGAWGNRLRARVDNVDIPAGDVATTYNLTVRDMATGEQERFAKISTVAASPRSLDKVLASSTLVRAVTPVPATRPTDHVAPTNPGDDPLNPAGGPAGTFTAATANSGHSGDLSTELLMNTAITGVEANKTGIYALLKTDIFNMLVFPPLALAEVGSGNPTLVSEAVLSLALNLCVDRRAMLLVDTSSTWTSVSEAVTRRPSITLTGPGARNAALYFPRLRVTDPDPAMNGRKIDMPPAGAVAGVYGRTDVARGVWKAPAGTDAALNGVPELSLPMTDLENGRLNPLGVNCLRSFPIVGRVVWGARTLRGADVEADEYKYVPVRRLALFIEESLYRGTKWVVFEPNDEPLWAQIRLNVGAFMQNLFRQGAFQGSSPKDAYFVKCDKDTTTQNHINLGIVNILVGFAPLKPAEFVIIKLQQMAGQVEV
ncbi:MAG TPA: phage tail sheath C-terminal domain-containing protein [Pyrinomonadaceae bacterium]|nr:phage tail sheath C-terminal domain-containing protein [Pyrinomonadaceae bacterium]